MRQQCIKLAFRSSVSVASLTGSASEQVAQVLDVLERHARCKVLQGTAPAHRRSSETQRDELVPSLSFRTLFTGAGTHQCDTVSKVTRYQSASPCSCPCGFVGMFGAVTWLS